MDQPLRTNSSGTRGAASSGCMSVPGRRAACLRCLSAASAARLSSRRARIACGISCRERRCRISASRRLKVTAISAAATP